MVNVTTLVKHPMTLSAQAMIEEVDALTHKAAAGGVSPEVAYALQMSFEQLHRELATSIKRLRDAHINDPAYLSFRRTVDGFIPTSPTS